MILSRVIEHMQQQHWSGVFIELVIVVLGVYIGLQAQDWNQARQDRALEHQYLERLRNDFAQSAKGAEVNIKAMERQYRLEGKMVTDLRQCRLDDKDRADFAAGIYYAGRIEPPPLVRGTIDELRSSGRTTIIESLALRQTIAKVVRSQEKNAEVLGYIMARMTPEIVYIDRRATQLLPPDSAKAISNAPSPGHVVFDFATLCHDSTYMNAVSAIQVMTDVVIGHDKDRLKDYRDLVKMIDVELGQRSATAPGNSKS